ncbi:MAG TPA: hypothetical protein PKE27_06400 [Povalibacter sp.]|uniref:hypothetical protein n=1 Tax=Povalibacter sp. TaxID=1962978 RepID=UPI002B6BBD38|nr:hypothetical protein [Povalibacter sp.]HMN44180.1 hypothetical protein [Povalibacter sp.]
MNKFFSILAIAASVALPVAGAMASDLAKAGTILVSADGVRLGPVYRVAGDGSAQLIIKGKMATVPVATLSMVDGRLTTSLSKNDVGSLN